MSPSFPNFEHLDVSQRLELISQLWDSISEAEEMAVPDWHRQELARRLQNADTSPELGIPWEEVKNRLREKT